MKIWQKIFKFTLSGGFALNLYSIALATPTERCTMLFFDLGNTLLDTSQRDAKGNILASSYLPGAKEYLEELRQSSYPLGLVVNVPQGWGVKELKDYVGSLWSDSQVPMDWTLFDGTILVPGQKAYRKPHRKMFCEAVRMAEERGCQALYQGEDYLLPQKMRIDMIRTARAAGMTSVLVDRYPMDFSELDSSERGDLIPVSEIKAYMEANPPHKVRNYCDGY